VRHLEPPGAARHCQLDDPIEIVDVLPVDHGVDGERDPSRTHQLRKPQLLGVAAAIAADAIGVGRLGVLDRQL